MTDSTSLPTTYEVLNRQIAEANQRTAVAESKTADVDNALVAQKNHILHMLANGQVYDAKDMLDIFAPLWKALRYGYKVHELYARIRSDAHDLARDKEDLASTKRGFGRSCLVSEAQALVKLAEECWRLS